MSQNQGTLIAAPIQTFDTADEFPTAYANDIAGGWHTAPDAATMNAIPVLRLVQGMICWVTGESKAYQWSGSAWGPASFGGVPVLALQYGESFGTNECFKNVAGVITHVTSKDAVAPFVDGLTLQSGATGQTYPVACSLQQPYATPLVLPSAGPSRNLFLSQAGGLTGVVPSKAAGDSWLLVVARYVAPQTFMFAPGSPVQLS